MTERDGTMLQIDGLPGIEKNFPIATHGQPLGRFRKKASATVSMTRLDCDHQVQTPSALQTGKAGDVLVIAQDGQAWTIPQSYLEANYELVLLDRPPPPPPAMHNERPLSQQPLVSGTALSCMPGRRLERSLAVATFVVAVAILALRAAPTS